MTNNGSTRLLRWILFTLVFSLTPFLGRLLAYRLMNIPVTSTAMFGQGDLLLLVTAICAEASGEIFSAQSGRVMNSRWMFLWFACLFLAVVSILGFGIAIAVQVAKENVGGLRVDPSDIVLASFILFPLACIVAAVSKVVEPLPT